jgi:glycosyltransferase involved in cell wall biosynthesis
MSLRILHVTPYFADAWGYGGIPRVASTLARELGARGHKVTVCTTDAADGTRRTPPVGAGADHAERWNCVKVHTFRNVSNTLAYHLQCFLPRGLASYLAAHARTFDVAHLHACRNLPVTMAARQLGHAGVPYVLAPNGTAPRLERRRTAKWVYDLAFGRHDVERAAAVLAVSEAERVQLERMGIPAARIRVLGNPIDLDEHADRGPRGRFREKHGLGERPLVLFLGKLTPRKRADALVRAFALMGPSNAQLVIAGNDMGAGASARSEVRRLGLEAKTRFVDLLRGAERLDALGDADLVVYPSADEVFGLVPLEALLASTPVVVTDDSGCGEIVRSTGGGLVVPLGDDEALARAMSEMLRSPEKRRDEAARAAAEVRSRFGGRVIAEKLDVLYHDLLARPH